MSDLSNDELFQQDDAIAIQSAYAEDSILKRLKDDEAASELAFTESSARLGQLALEKKRIQRSIAEAKSKFNRMKRRIAARERALVERFMADKVIWLRRKLGIKPRSV